MPADDLVLNVRQIANYPDAGFAQSTDKLLLQRGGLGGPYYSLDAFNFVATALAGGGPLSVGVSAPGNSYPGNIFSTGLVFGPSGFVAANIYSATDAGPTLWRYLQNGPGAVFGINQFAGLVVDFAPGGAAGGLASLIRAMTLTSTGAMTLNVGTLTVARDPIASMEVATAQWVAASTVASFNGRSGAVELNLNDIECAGGASLTSPRFNGSPRAQTPENNSNSSRLATTAFVHSVVMGYINDFADNAQVVTTFNGRFGAVTLTEQDIIQAGGALIFDSPQFTGVPTAPTASPGTNTEQLATTAFVNAALSSSTVFAPINSPAFTGQPTGPTAAPGTSDGQLATTAFVEAAVTESTTGVVSFNARTGVIVLTTADITGAGGATLTSPAFTGTPSAPTQAPGTSNTTLATTAFVAAAVGVQSFNGRTGAVTLSTADITAAGGAPLASPTFTGAPAAPTAAPGTSTAQLATTAFVSAAIAAGVVSSFNGRSGAVSLIANDISAAGGAILVSPAFTGTPTAPTAAPGVNTTQIATTAYVTAALATVGGVQSFNGRAGVVTLAAADITGAGGALLASPTFTGAPAAPTATAGTNTTQIATTAFVNAALAAGGFVTLAGPSTINQATLNQPVVNGVTNGSSAAAGVVGEIQSGVTATPIGLTTNAVAGVTSLNLTAGDWDVHGEVWLNAGTGGLTAVHAAINTTAAVPTAPGVNSSRTTLSFSTAGALIPSGACIIPCSACRISVTATTTVFLLVIAAFPSGTVTGTGRIYARRAR
jgi:hypothetical protein